MSHAMIPFYAEWENVRLDDGVDGEGKDDYHPILLKNEEEATETA